MTQTQSATEKLSSINPGDCSIWVLGFVDAGIVQDGKPDGLYFIDTNVNAGIISASSENPSEATNSLNTLCSNNDNIAWTVYGFSPYGGTNFPQIYYIGGSNVWGADGQPFQISSDMDVFTGKVESTSGGSYAINLYAKQATTGKFVQPSTTLNITVQ
ncbi:hypothetical protein KTO58_02665 [Chitinophaga pendula]|uniref:hypothetical protein n=1 Tax=Chitinophaga TaxID=79328 RepID=UPI000BB05F72|nr:MULTISPECIES: hypothetical protein [Chitinophaga]ASZ14254.1 hypothetical protein CK934_26555 [Chitinophaga sp. MD30]UCJ08102.1 hypothetical protein KTO58_02665 [Chitinophaga pendula]